ncbi:alanine racemase [Spirochaeta africana]|nr:alanine racemase [Spirochaeta africana]
MRPTRALVHISAIRHNIRLIREQYIRQAAAEPIICAAVKANAYGHGAVEVARAVLDAGAACLGVAVPEEGIELRQAGISAAILLFSPFFPEESTAIAENNLVPMVFDAERITALNAAAERSGRTTDVYLKIDTGMGRVGCSMPQAVELATAIQSSRGLRLVGLATHFAASDGSSLDFARTQLGRFRDAAATLRAADIDPGILSAANSGAVITMPDSAGLDMARPGIMIYGYYPSHDVSRPLQLQPAMTLESAVGFIKQVPAGTPISYGMTYTTARETRIATIPIGYADGVFRALSNRGRVWIKGRTYPIVGRICMDQLMVDIGMDSGITLYDRAVLFGPPQPAPAHTPWPEDPPTAEEVADLCDTIPYEITCAVSGRIPRVYVD